MRAEAERQGLDVHAVHLVSAKTGYGVRNMVSKASTANYILAVSVAVAAADDAGCCL